MFRLLCLASAFFTAFFGVVLLALGARLLGFEVHASWLWVGAPLLIVGVVVVETWLVEALLGRRFGQRLSRLLLGLVSAAGVSAGVIPAGLAEVLPWRSVRSSGAKQPPRTVSAWIYEDAHGLVRMAKDYDEVPARFRRNAHPVE
ncbi:MAG: hypothetical protein Q8S33_17730 [Myxococcales bacterium]|nr:hypothetical protein [Myxococcales bacterium]MDP3502178.1 hypothetical protein [Myxococcales bacterium]